MNKYGLYRFASVSPELRVGDVEYNVNVIVDTVNEVIKNDNPHIIAFPELCITGYSCGRAFLTEDMLTGALNGLNAICENITKHTGTIVIVSLPLSFGGRTYDVAAVIRSKQILGFIPKVNLSSEESMYFSSGRDIPDHSRVFIKGLYGILDIRIGIGTNLLFQDAQGEFSFGVELGKDYELLGDNYSKGYILNGAAAIFNLSAVQDCGGSAAQREMTISGLSSIYKCAYIFVSAGPNESSQNGVFSGHCFNAVNGQISASNYDERYSFKTIITVDDIDVRRLISLRKANNTKVSGGFGDVAPVKFGQPNCDWGANKEPLDLKYFNLSRVPYLDTGHSLGEIVMVQSTALCKRIKHTGTKRLVLGVSGGLDSTLALLICKLACYQLGLKDNFILAVTMPGFGTSGRTYSNAVELIKALKCDFKEISITDLASKMYDAIGHNIDDKDITYENAQARVRTEILMNLANQEHGIVIGTGDLSEAALGWCTYNGDHMSMYNVNCSIPKTVMREVIKYLKDQLYGTKEMGTILDDICDTPVSPELLPPDENGEIKQKTEESIGSYELNDFFLYHFLEYGASREKISFLAQKAFNEYSKEFIDNALERFMKRFVTQQFKRSCAPDGPKAVQVSMTSQEPRIPTDLSYSLYVSQDS